MRESPFGESHAAGRSRIKKAAQRRMRIDRWTVAELGAE
jgi:hypothetical protein